jgi:hypothetical protein
MFERIMGGGNEYINTFAPIMNSLGMLKGKTSLVKELAKSRRQDAE